MSQSDNVVNLKNWQIGQNHFGRLVVEVETRSHAILHECGCIEWFCDDDNCKCEKVWAGAQCPDHATYPHYPT